MHGLPEFHLLHPATVAEAVAMGQEEPGARFVAGGTDLLVNMRRLIAAPPTLIDLTDVAEMREITVEDGTLVVGAAATLAELAADPRVRRTWPVLATAAGTVAGPTHRQVATVGGNLCLDTRCIYYNQSEWWRWANDYCLKERGEVCHVAPGAPRCWAAFSGDLAPAALVMGAEAVVAGPDGARTMPLDDLYGDDGATPFRLGAGELLTAIRVPDPGGLRGDYAKSRVRGAIDFPLAGVAVALRRDGDHLADLRVALTATNVRPDLVTGTETLLHGPLDDDRLSALERLVGKQIQPMRSTVTSSQYRRRVAAALLRRLVAGLFAAE